LSMGEAFLKIELLHRVYIYIYILAKALTYDAPFTDLT